MLRSKKPVVAVCAIAFSAAAFAFSPVAAIAAPIPVAGGGSRQELVAQPADKGDENIITQDMTSQEILDLLRSNGDNPAEFTVMGGDYTGKRIECGKSDTLYVDGKVENLSGGVFNGATVKGVHGDRSVDQLLFAIDGDKVQFGDASGAKGYTVSISDVTLGATGNSRYLMYWVADDISVSNSAFYANGNADPVGGGIYVAANASNFNADSSDISFSGNGGSAGKGVWCDGDSGLVHDVYFNIEGGSFKLNDNGLNGHGGYYGSNKHLVHYNFKNCEAEACRNGADQTSGSKGDGFSYAYVSVVGGSLKVDGNRNNGIAGGSGSGTSFEATDGAVVSASENGNYGIAVSILNDDRETTDILDATLAIEGNGNVGLRVSTGLNVSGSTVNADGNGREGIYALGDTSISNSTVTANKNGSDGIKVTKDSSVSGVELSANENAYSGFYASKGLNVSGSSIEIKGNKCESGDRGALTVLGNATVDETNKKIDVLDNSGTVSNLNIGSIHLLRHCGSGIYIGEDGSLDLRVGRVTGNVINDAEEPTGEAKGGGVYSLGSFTMGPGVQVYNNSAASAGDDIYSPRDAELKIGLARDMGSDLVLTNDGNSDPSDDQVITHWFYDGVNKDYDGPFGEAGKTHRWERDVYTKIYYVKVTDTTTDEVAIKAAYGPQTSIAPIDLTLYKGGDGYDNVSGAEGTTNGFPEPGYYITLSDQINNEIGDSPEHRVDLTETKGLDFGYTYNNGDKINRSWHIGHYAGGASYADGGYAYTLQGDEGAEGMSPKLFVIDPETGEKIVSDDFDASTTTYTDFITKLGSAEAQTPDNAEDRSFLTANISYTTRDGKPRDLDCSATMGEGSLRVRAITDAQDENTITSVQSDASALEQGTPLALVDEDATFYINDTDSGKELEITDKSGVSLLFDEIVPEGDSSEEREGWLQEKAEQVAEDTGAFEDADIEEPAYEFKYLDLVDANNGNVYLTSDSPVTVYWPYPEGTDKDTDFALLHYADLHRENAPEDIEGAIMSSDVEVMDIKKLDDHIEFTTDSFSPFALVWDTSTDNGGGIEEPEGPEDPSTGGSTETPAPGDDKPSSDKPAAGNGDVLPATGDSSTAMVLGVAVAGAALIFAGVKLLGNSRLGSNGRR